MIHNLMIPNKNKNKNKYFHKSNHFAEVITIKKQLIKIRFIFKYYKN